MFDDTSEIDRILTKQTKEFKFFTHIGVTGYKQTFGTSSLSVT